MFLWLIAYGGKTERFHCGIHLLLNSCGSFLPSLTFLHAIKGPDKDRVPQKARLIDCSATTIRDGTQQILCSFGVFILLLPFCIVLCPSQGGQLVGHGTILSDMTRNKLTWELWFLVHGGPCSGIELLQ